MRVHDPRFADAVQAVVVGRDIDEVHVDKLAGSSRTPDGFNAALEQIKAEAAKQKIPHKTTGAAHPQPPSPGSRRPRSGTMRPLPPR